MDLRSGVVLLSRALDAGALRIWIGNDASQRNQNASIPDWNNSFSLGLGWREKKGAPIVPVGTFQLDIARLLAAGLVRRESSDHVRVRIIHTSDGAIRLQTRLDAPCVVLGRV